jgi:hypothetical protein
MTAMTAVTERYISHRPRAASVSLGLRRAPPETPEPCKVGMAPWVSRDSSATVRTRMARPPIQGSKARQKTTLSGRAG